MKIGDLLPRAAICGGALTAAVLACTGSDPELPIPDKDAGLASDGSPDPTKDPTKDPADGGGGDAPVRKPKCSGAPFTDFHIVPGLSSDAEEFSVTLSATETTAYVTRPAPSHGVDVYVATRMKPTAPFGTPMPFDEVNGVGDESGVSLSNDGFSLFVASSTPSSGASAYILQYKGNGTNPVGKTPPVDLSAALATGGQDLFPLFAPTSELFFSHGPSEAQELWRTRRLSDGGFGDAGIVSELASSSLTQGVAVESDGLTIFFGSTRPGSANFDIWTATRSSVDAPFGAPVQVENINTAYKERASWISPDDCRLYFISDRPPPEDAGDGGGGGRDVWVAERTPR